MGRFHSHSQRSGWDRAVPLSLGLILILMFPKTGIHAASDARTERMTQVVDGLKERLGIPQSVLVQIVPVNSRAFSVQRNGQDFMVTVDTDFLMGLDDDETIAALAHELGHVWIYTHHPFLHTEDLANQIAMRVVSREALQKLYLKVAAFEAHAKTSGQQQLIGNNLKNIR
jgi:hypothetical protein